MTFAEAMHRGIALPRGTEIPLSYDEFMDTLKNVPPHMGYPEHRALDVRLQIAGCWFVMDCGPWDEHAYCLRTAGWIQ